MKSRKDSFGFDISGIGAKFSSPALDTISEQQARMGEMFQPHAALSAFVEQQKHLQSIMPPPVIEAITAHQNFMTEHKISLSEMVSANNNLPQLNALAQSAAEQQKYLQSIMPPSSVFEAITNHQNLLADHGLAAGKAIAQSINFPQLNALAQSAAASVASAVECHAFDLATAMGSALEAYIPKHDMMVTNLSRALEAALPQFNAIGEMALKIANSIPKIDLAVCSLAQQALGSYDVISSSLQSSISALIDSLKNVRLPNFDHLAGHFNYIRNFEEKNEVLKGFGWYLISELPEDIVETIYERHHEITQEEVDALIVEHFRQDRCCALKKIINSWIDLPYFEKRRVIFHQAQVCHSRRTFNASVALVSIHFEGVIADFVRGKLPVPTNSDEERALDKKLKCKNALSSISDLANDISLDIMPFTDWIVCSFVLECIDAAFTTNFSPSNPDNCPNTSRHKIAHGHAVAKETEANSLRRFLFMNELYKLFYCLEGEYEMAS